MTDEHDAPPTPPSPPTPDLGEQDDAAPVSDATLEEQERSMRALFATMDDARPSRAPLLLPGVQRKLRERSRGKFFGDRWSTTPSRAIYSVVALIMLLIVAIAYFALGPTGLSG